MTKKAYKSYEEEFDELYSSLITGYSSIDTTTFQQTSFYEYLEFNTDVYFLTNTSYSIMFRWISEYIKNMGADDIASIRNNTFKAGMKLLLNTDHTFANEEDKKLGLTSGQGNYGWVSNQDILAYLEEQKKTITKELLYSSSGNKQNTDNTHYSGKRICDILDTQKQLAQFLDKLNDVYGQDTFNDDRECISVVNLTNQTPMVGYVETHPTNNRSLTSLAGAPGDSNNSYASREEEQLTMLQQQLQQQNEKSSKLEAQLAELIRTQKEILQRRQPSLFPDEDPSLPTSINHNPSHVTPHTHLPVILPVIPASSVSSASHDTPVASLPVSQPKIQSVSPGTPVSSATSVKDTTSINHVVTPVAAPVVTHKEQPQKQIVNPTTTSHDTPVASSHDTSVATSHVTPVVTSRDTSVVTPKEQPKINHVTPVDTKPVPSSDSPVTQSVTPASLVVPVTSASHDTPVASLPVSQPVSPVTHSKTQPVTSDHTPVATSRDTSVVTPVVTPKEQTSGNTSNDAAKKPAEAIASVIQQMSVKEHDNSITYQPLNPNDVYPTNLKEQVATREDNSVNAPVYQLPYTPKTIPTDTVIKQVQDPLTPKNIDDAKILVVKEVRDIDFDKIEAEKKMMREQELALLREEQEKLIRKKKREAEMTLIQQKLAEEERVRKIQARIQRINDQKKKMAEDQGRIDSDANIKIRARKRELLTTFINDLYFELYQRQLRYRYNEEIMAITEYIYYDCLLNDEITTHIINTIYTLFGYVDYHQQGIIPIHDYIGVYEKRIDNTHPMMLKKVSLPEYVHNQQQLGTYNTVLHQFQKPKKHNPCMSLEMFYKCMVYNHDQLVNFTTVFFCFLSDLHLYFLDAERKKDKNRKKHSIHTKREQDDAYIDKAVSKQLIAEEIKTNTITPDDELEIIGDDEDTDILTYQGLVELDPTITNSFTSTYHLITGLKYECEQLPWVQDLFVGKSRDILKEEYFSASNLKQLTMRLQYCVTNDKDLTILSQENMVKLANAFSNYTFQLAKNPPAMYTLEVLQHRHQKKKGFWDDMPTMRKELDKYIDADLDDDRKFKNNYAQVIMSCCNNIREFTRKDLIDYLHQTRLLCYYMLRVGQLSEKQPLDYFYLEDNVRQCLNLITPKVEYTVAVCLYNIEDSYTIDPLCYMGYNGVVGFSQYISRIDKVWKQIVHLMGPKDFLGFKQIYKLCKVFEDQLYDNFDLVNKNIIENIGFPVLQKDGQYATVKQLTTSVKTKIKNLSDLLNQDPPAEMDRFLAEGPPKPKDKDDKDDKDSKDDKDNKDDKKKDAKDDKKKDDKPKVQVPPIQGSIIRMYEWSIDYTFIDELVQKEYQNLLYKMDEEKAQKLAIQLNEPPIVPVRKEVVKPLKTPIEVMHNGEPTHGIKSKNSLHHEEQKAMKKPTQVPHTAAKPTTVQKPVQHASHTNHPNTNHAKGVPHTATKPGTGQKQMVRPGKSSKTPNSR